MSGVLVSANGGTKRLCIDVMCFALPAEHSRRANQKLSPAAQYVQLIKAVQETRTLADVLACFNGADLVLSDDDMMFQVQQLVSKLKQKLPKLERRWVNLDAPDMCMLVTTASLSLTVFAGCMTWECCYDNQQVIKMQSLVDDTAKPKLCRSSVLACWVNCDSMYQGGSVRPGMLCLRLRTAW
jgi:hypothetical protein